MAATIPQYTFVRLFDSNRNFYWFTGLRIDNLQNPFHHTIKNVIRDKFHEGRNEPYILNRVKANWDYFTDIPVEDNTAGNTLIQAISRHPKFHGITVHYEKEQRMGLK
jgi:hypothetical protein